MSVPVSAQTYQLPEALADQVKASVDAWRAGDKLRRLWRHDASLWTGTDEASWMGWLDVTADQIAHGEPLRSAVTEVKKEGFTDILLLGMGGSSLCPDVLKETFGKMTGFPELHVLDSTDPAQVKAFENRVNLAKTLFIVSSKSGSTLEPNIFKQYFFERARQAVGADRVGSHFIAITDPGSKMQQVAEADRFRHVFFGLSSIGGRYSALSNFGVVPGALMGLDMHRFLGRIQEMVGACGADVSVEQNPGAVLGLILGTAARNGRDKVTILTSPGLSALGAWLEQLLAESTGKQGKGIVPVDREQPGSPEDYGSDRVFAYVRLRSDPDQTQQAKVEALEKAGHAVVRIVVGDIYDLGQEFFRWEIATAVAGAVIGINPFNQPDVEASKVATRTLTTEYEKSGSLPAENPILEEGGVKLFTDAKNALALTTGPGSERSLVGYLRAHIRRAGAGDYFALLAYIQMNVEHETLLQKLRHALRDKKRVATCLEFGPRFLHSTGQAYKGGPNSGVFLQITCSDPADLPVPGARYTFGVVKAAQARGDFDVLADRGRRALRVHLSGGVESGLKTLASALEQALK
jgi:transaldolase / glucose-6-phosphate isomerase